VQGTMWSPRATRTRELPAVMRTGVPKSAVPNVGFVNTVTVEALHAFVLAFDWRIQTQLNAYVAPKLAPGDSRASVALHQLGNLQKVMEGPEYMHAGYSKI
jgi:hypothetical protein